MSSRPVTRSSHNARGAGAGATCTQPCRGSSRVVVPSRHAREALEAIESVGWSNLGRGFVVPRTLAGTKSKRARDEQCKDAAGREPVRKRRSIRSEQPMAPESETGLASNSNSRSVDQSAPATSQLSRPRNGSSRTRSTHTRSRANGDGPLSNEETQQQQLDEMPASIQSSAANSTNIRDQDRNHLYNTTLIASRSAITRAIYHQRIGHYDSPMLKHLTAIAQNGNAQFSRGQPHNSPVMTAQDVETRERRVSEAAKAFAAQLLWERADRISRCEELWKSCSAIMRREIRIAATGRARETDEGPDRSALEQSRINRVAGLWQSNPSTIEQSHDRMEAKIKAKVRAVLNYHEDITWETNTPRSEEVTASVWEEQRLIVQMHGPYKPLASRIKTTDQMQAFVDWITAISQGSDPTDADGQALEPAEFWDKFVNSVLLDSNADSD